MSPKIKATLTILVLILMLILSEAWALKGYFSDNLEFEPVLAFIAAISALIANDKIINVLGFSPKLENHDQSLFIQFKIDLPYDPTVRYIKEQDFGDSFRREHILTLNNFTVLWNSPEKEFLDQKIEAKRKIFHSTATKLANEIAARTVPLRDATFASVYSDSARSLSGGARPKHIVDDAKVINSLAESFVKQHSEFIRYCTKRLIE